MYAERLIVRKIKKENIIKGLDTGSYVTTSPTLMCGNRKKFRIPFRKSRSVNSYYDDYQKHPRSLLRRSHRDDTT